MPFTSASDLATGPILSLDGVSLVFCTDIHRAQSWRDAFTRAVKNPASTLADRHETLEVAKNISFEVWPGDHVALLGVNGTGKTSLCRAIAGAYRPTSGKITVRGTIRAIFDTAIGIQPELTGRENAELLAQFLYPGDPDLKRLIEEALEFSELGKFLDVPYRLYSNGMQTRLCLSMISCRPCDLFILDEVFEGADTFFREKISAKMLDIMKRSGAVLFVSHSEEQIRRVCNRAILLHEGRIQFDGGIEDALAHYHRLRR